MRRCDLCPSVRPSVCLFVRISSICYHPRAILWRCNWCLSECIYSIIRCPAWLQTERRLNVWAAEEGLNCRWKALLLVGRRRVASHQVPSSRRTDGQNRRSVPPSVRRSTTAMTFGGRKGLRQFVRNIQVHVSLKHAAGEENKFMGNCKFNLNPVYTRT